MKKTLCVILVVCVLLVLASCGSSEKKTLHCDRCGVEVEVEKNSNMAEDWIIYCETCNEELFGDDPLLGGN